MIARRALLAAPALLLARPLWAGALCRPGPAGTICETSLPVAPVPARRPHPNWCWAAVVEAIFAFQGVEVTQEAVMQRAFGPAPDAPLPGQQVALALNGAWDDVHGDGWEVACEVLANAGPAFSQPDIVRLVAAELAAGNALVLGGPGHVMVLVGMVYATTSAGPQPQQLHLLDPAPGGPGRRVLQAPALLASSFLARLVVA